MHLSTSPVENAFRRIQSSFAKSPARDLAPIFGEAADVASGVTLTGQVKSSEKYLIIGLLLAAMVLLPKRGKKR